MSETSLTSPFVGVAAMCVGSRSQRDILPLPHLVVPSRVQVLSRSVARRRLRLRHGIEWANTGIDALNSLSGFSGVAPGLPGAAGQLCLNRLRQTYLDMGSPPGEASGYEGALSELLASSAVYGDCRRDIRPYALDLVSWPRVGSAPVDLTSALPEADRLWIAGWKGHMLRDAADASAARDALGVSRPFCEPTLMAHGRTYAQFLLRLESCGMLRFRKASAGEYGLLGAFFVAKKDKQIRLIFDTRFLNCIVQRPPPNTPFPRLLPSPPSRQTQMIRLTLLRPTLRTHSIT